MVSVGRIAAIVMIFLIACAAWVTLAGSIRYRTDFSYQDQLGKVSSQWGSEQHQKMPSFYLIGADGANGREVFPDTNDVKVDLKLDHRRVGLQWYSTYTVDFGGRYVLKDIKEQPKSVRLHFDFPVPKAVYENFTINVNGKSVLDEASITSSAEVVIPIEDGKETVVEISYTTQGLDRWFYTFSPEARPQYYQMKAGSAVEEMAAVSSRDQSIISPAGATARIKNFNLTMTTNFDAIDFPAQTLSPSAKQKTPQGWNLEWKYDTLISGLSIGMEMPNKLNPGPIAARVTLFAPISLLFFFVILLMFSVARKIEIHPVNYAFLAAGFFSFHLLFAYLVDHMEINLAFALSAATSILLVVSYLRLVVDSKFAMREAGLAQLVYLILFSYAFFFKGYTGLTITVGSIITLFVLMQLTGRIKWSEEFSRNAKSKKVSGTLSTDKQ